MKVEFPEKVWGRLASIADNRGVSIADVIVEAAQIALGERPAPVQREWSQGALPKVPVDDPAVEARIRDLVGMNRSMNEVAQLFGVSRHAMRTAYRHLGIRRESNTNPKEGN